MALAGDAQGGISGQRQAGDKHHHPPDLVGIERVVRAVVLIRQNGQDDERKHRELQDGNQIQPGQAVRDIAQFGFEVEQRGSQDGQRDGELLQIEPDQCAQRIADHDGGDRGGAGVCRVGVLEIGCHHHAAHDHQPGPQHPGRTGFFGQQRAQRAGQRDQREGAQAGARGRRTLAFQADQQADGEAGQERIERGELIGRHDLIMDNSGRNAGGCAANPVSLAQEP